MSDHDKAAAKAVRIDCIMEAMENLDMLQEVSIMNFESLQRVREDHRLIQVSIEMQRTLLKKLFNHEVNS